MKKLNKRWLISSLALCPLQLFAFAGGVGSADDPYLIENCEQLQRIKDYPNKNFNLANDIDCKDFDYGDGMGFYPIDDYEDATFDGKGFIIKGLTIKRPDMSNVALFQYVTRAQLKHIVLVNVDITGYSRVASLISYGSRASVTDSSAQGYVTARDRIAGGLIATQRTNGTGPCPVTNSYANVEVRAVGDYVGGLVGEFENCEMNNSYATGNVYSDGDYVGGLVGYNGKNIYKSYATGKVRGNIYVGGLIGRTTRSDISDNYATGDVEGKLYVGGLVGYVSNRNKVHRNYSIGKVTGEKYVGGLLGYSDRSDEIANSYWNIETSGQNFSAGGEARKTVQMYQQDNYHEWDFNRIWTINNGQGYPLLKISLLTSNSY